MMPTSDATLSSNTMTEQSIKVAKDDAADSVIRNHALLAAGAGLIPVPGMDVAAVTGIQINMIRKLSEIYQVPFDATDVRTILSATATTGLSKLVSYAVNSYTSLFSEFGSFSDNLTHGLVAGAATFGTGEIIQAHFEKGGNMLNLNYTHFISYYQTKIQDGDLIPNDIMQIESGIRSAMQAVSTR